MDNLKLRRVLAFAGIGLITLGLVAMMYGLFAGSLVMQLLGLWAIFVTFLISQLVGELRRASLGKASDAVYAKKMLSVVSVAFVALGLVVMTYGALTGGFAGRTYLPVAMLACFAVAGLIYIGSGQIVRYLEPALARK